MYEGKRGFDIAGAAALLLVTAPLLALAALAVLLALGRPILFRQTRAGQGGRPFTLLKLRSMAAGAGPDSARLGRFGRALRASSLDELPQLWNVLRGEMSLVGPRPLPMDYVPLYSARQRARLAVRPGICGLAQAAGRNAVPWPLRLRLDVAYTRRASLALDLRIIVACMVLVLRGQGVAAPGQATMAPFAPGPAAAAALVPRAGGAMVPRAGGAMVPRAGGAMVPRAGGAMVPRAEGTTVTTAQPIATPAQNSVATAHPG